MTIKKIEIDTHSGAVRAKVSFIRPGSTTRKIMLEDGSIRDGIVDGVVMDNYYVTDIEKIYDLIGKLECQE